MRMFGGTPAPWTISWTGEERFFLDECPYAGRRAICQLESWSAGKPQFGKPHSVRQRRAIALELCALCEKPLKNRTRVSLSHARPVGHSARGWEVLQVEPMLHRECARISMQHCPSLRRDIRVGTLAIRQVFRSAVQFAVMDRVYTKAITGVDDIAVGHAIVQLVKWTDRDVLWLEKAAA